MVLCGVAKSGFSKRTFPVSIGFGEVGDGYFVTAPKYAVLLTFRGC